MKKQLSLKFYFGVILVFFSISLLKSCNSYKSLDDFDYYFVLLAIKYTITDNEKSTNTIATETNHSISFQGETIKTKMIATNFPTQKLNLKFVYAYSYDYENNSIDVSNFNRHQSIRRNSSTNFFFPEVYNIIEITKGQKNPKSYPLNPIYFKTNTLNP